MIESKKKTIPKILFLGAITFEETSGSHTLFYRLFKNYPPEKLVVIGSHKSRNPRFPKATLPNVKYHIIKDSESPTITFRRIPFIRKIKQRLYIARLLQFYFQKIEGIIKDFKPDVILSLTMDYHWYVAYHISKKMDIPLDLVLHDRWEPNVDKYIRTFLQGKFRKVFSYARNRFCISPTMEHFYFEQLGIHSDVVYPIGTLQNYEKHEEKVVEPLKIVYFGNIWAPQPTLIQLAHLLDKKGMELVIFSNQDIEFFKKNGLKSSNLIAYPFRKQAELMAWCNAHASIFYLPMYFDEKEKDMIRCSFPSKLVDYTSLGLPVIIHAPERSSIVQFTKQYHNLPFAEVITNEDEISLEKAISALMNEQHRKKLGDNSLKIWRKVFAPEVVRKTLFDKIIQSN